MNVKYNDTPRHRFSGPGGIYTHAALIGWQLKRVTSVDIPVNAIIKVTVPLIKRVYPRLVRKRRLTVRITETCVKPRPSCKRFT